MAFNVKYRCEFDTILNRSVRVDIEQDGTFTVQNLTAFGESPLYIEYPNAEFDKLTGIRESKVKLSILGGDELGITASDFLTTSDNQYKIKIYIDNTLEWIGWMDNDQLSEPFKDTLYEIVLSATDGISLLKNIPLVNLSDEQIWGIDRVKNFINFCFDKTELGLNWWSFINMYPVLESGGSLFDVDQRGVNADFDAFYYANITSFTFLTGPRTFEDCYTVLSKIMEAFCCTLFQARGKWYIIQLNDRIAGDLDGTERDATGAAVGTATNQNFSIPIGLYQTQKLADQDALIGWEKAFKQAKILYEFEMPPVFFRNWDLQDGTINIPLSTTSRQVYNILNWTEVVSDTYVGVEINSLTGQEFGRYMLQYPVVPYSDNTVQPSARTTNYWVSLGDKINFSYSTREKNSGFVNTSQFNYVILTDGVSTYYLDDDGKWYTTIKAIGYSWGLSEDRRIWKAFNIETEECPIAGNISVQFTAIGNSRTASNEVHYKDLFFDIITSYDKRYGLSRFDKRYGLKGYEHSESQSSILKNNYDNQIYISSTDNISVQGAITNNNYATFAGFKYYSDAKEDLLPFYRYINRVYWRGVYRNYQRLESTVFNLYSTRLLSLLNTVTFDEIPDKEFMITTMNSDIRNERSDIRFVELRDTSTTNDFDQIGTELFKFIVDKEEIFNEIKEDKRPIDWRLGPFGAIAQLIIRGKRRRFNNYG